MQWADDSPHLIVKLARHALQAQLQQLAQAPLGAPLVFDLALPLDQPGSAALLQLVLGMRAMLEAAGGATDGERPGQAGGFGHALLAEQAENFLMSSLLLHARHNHSEALAPGPVRHWLPRSVRRAEEYMASRLDQPVSLAELCQQVGVSARTLQAAFLQHRGEGPMVFWRHARLDRVHQLLRSGEVPPGAAPVADVAARHGFLHAGRFAADYRQRFGESPSQTLARARH
jgi:AraC-like DNA-binding protein